MIKFQVESWWWFKLNGLLRWCLVHRVLPNDSIVLTEYPKSGGTWIGQMISDALKIPFPRNRLPLFGKKQLLHGHYKLTWNIRNPIVVFRDGRDIVVSQYFHYLIYNEKNKYLVDKHRKYFKVEDYENVVENLPKFIEYVNNTKYHHFTWSEFVNSWINQENIIFTSYEKFRKNPVDELIRVTNLLAQRLSQHEAEVIVDKYFFRKLYGRKEGEENNNSFLRKGIVGDGKNYFNKESKKVFKEYAGRELIKLGYKKDFKW